MASMIKSVTKDLIENNVTIDNHSQCWNWNGALKSNGYGVIRRSGKSLTVHRVSFMLWNGEIKSGMEICHSCDNRKCCNPSHLFAGTRKDNVRDMMIKGRQNWPGCPADERHHQAKLKNHQVRYIRKAGVRAADLAIAFGVTVRTIHNAKSGRTYANVD